MLLIHVIGSGLSPLSSHDRGKSTIFLFAFGNPGPYKLKWKMIASSLAWLLFDSSSDIFMASRSAAGGRRGELGFETLVALITALNFLELGCEKVEKGILLRWADSLGGCR